jgi:hypothetical protein
VDRGVINRVGEPIRPRRKRKIDGELQPDVECLQMLLLTGICTMPPKDANPGNGDLIHATGFVAGNHLPGRRPGHISRRFVSHQRVKPASSDHAHMCRS